MVEKSSVEDGGQLFSTIPMGIVVAKSAVITVCLEDSIILRSIAEGAVKGVHTALDTSGQPFSEADSELQKFDELMKVTDLFLLDLKQIDCGKHKKLTGWVNDNIRDLAVYLAVHRKKMWIRHVLVPGITTDEEDLKRLRSFLDHLREICPNCVERVEVLPYHTMGIAKYEKLGIPYPLEGVQPPTAEEIRRAEEILKG